MPCLNTVITNPDMVNTHISQIEPSNEVRRLDHEISRTLEDFGFDKEALRKKMLDCAALKYSDIDSSSHITKRLKADFEKSSPLSSFSADFCSRTVRSVRLGSDKEISITLINGQQIGREKQHDTDSGYTTTESGADDSCHPRE